MKVKAFGLACALTLTSGFLGACSSARPPADPDLALIHAAEKGRTDQIYRLLEAGANVNARDKDGWTPYLAASTMGHLEAMRVLRAFGARTEAMVEVENVAHRALAN
jgi:ankyrin repeat protein